MKPPLAWGRRVSPEFRSILYRGCAALGWPEHKASYLMACIAFESAETFNPAIKNMAGSSGTGLIQFMRSTAASLGTTIEKLERMSAEQQLAWVFKYLDQFSKLKGPQVTLSDMYLSILMPAYIGRPETTPIRFDARQYHANRGLDKNKNGIITKFEASAPAHAALKKGLSEPFVFIESVKS